MTKVKRALLSAYDKTGIVDFARALHDCGVELLSTGGTATLLRKSGLFVTDVSEVTKFPEMLDGRVKTLHPSLHAGLLARRDDPAHMKTLAEHGIRPIDLVVVSLYPFAEALRANKNEADIIEMIDIGGPSMLRGAAKNFEHVAAVCDPADYGAVAKEIARAGGVSLETRRGLAKKVFSTTAAYDSLIAGFFARSEAAHSFRKKTQDAIALMRSGTFTFDEDLALSFRKEADLRYGENPHQRAALYASAEGGGVVGAEKLNGKELSFNNILDLDAALEIADAFDEPACAIVKHVSPCGFALGSDPRDAFKRAHACDPLSAFGGIVGFNRPIDDRTASAILKAGFLECVVARGFSAKALDLLRTKKNLRLLAVPRRSEAAAHDFKRVRGGLLVQEPDVKDPSASDLKAVTKKKPTAAQVKDLLFAFKVCRYTKSNGIVVAKDGATVGLGMGQPSRVDACLTAFRKAGPRARGAVLASDGFFPKPDSIALAKKHGVKAVIQPGGSIQDEPVIAACDKAGIAMVFTGIRHFRH